MPSGGVVALAPGLTIMIPIIAYVVFERKIVAFLVSVPLGVAVLWTHMILQEASAADSDMDGVFALACLLWAVVIAFGYAALFIVLSLLRQSIAYTASFVSARNKDQTQPPESLVPNDSNPFKSPRLYRSKGPE